jgi:hypothetical protein
VLHDAGTTRNDIASSGDTAASRERCVRGHNIGEWAPEDRTPRPDPPHRRIAPRIARNAVQEPDRIEVRSEPVPTDDFRTRESAALSDRKLRPEVVERRAVLCGQPHVVYLPVHEVINRDLAGLHRFAPSLSRNRRDADDVVIVAYDA